MLIEKTPKRRVEAAPKKAYVALADLWLHHCHVVEGTIVYLHDEGAKYLSHALAAVKDEIVAIDEVVQDVSNAAESAVKTVAVKVADRLERAVKAADGDGK